MEEMVNAKTEQTVLMTMDHLHAIALMDGLLVFVVRSNREILN